MLNETNETLHMDKLCLTFLQKGHTENENDSVHSVIERATKHAVIYSPEQWYSAVRTARKSKTPHHVEELTHAQLIDYKKMSKSVKNLNTDDEGNKVKWSSARQFIVYGTDLQALYLTYEYGGAEKRVDLCRRQRASGNSLAPAQEASPPLRFMAMGGISRVKKDDVISLCQAGLVPVTYHSFYEGLPLCSGQGEESDEDYTMISKTLKKFKKTFFMRMFLYRCNSSALNRNKIAQLV